ncbi:MAG TPA: hypothetical protein PKD79_01940, partial [Candidatus Doudnabacteria bacterium]|nr:hypothetical protein [Candidatus Doudnabacteria bacterium]
FMYQYNQVGAGYWIPPINIWSIPDTLFRITLNIGAPSNIVMVLSTLAVVWIIWRFLRQYQQIEKWLTLAVFLAPFGGAFLFALLAKLSGGESSVYMVRYFIFTGPFLLIILAMWAARIQTAGIKSLLVIALLGASIFSVFYYWNEVDINDKPGMAALATFVHTNVEPEHKIYVASSFQFFNFKYYHLWLNKNSNQPLLYTNGNLTENLPHFAGTAILVDEELVLNFADSTEPGDIVWVIWTTGFGGSKPVVPSNWQQVDEQGFAEVRPYVGTWVVVTEYQVN